jgi:hypothetical protein
MTILTAAQNNLIDRAVSIFVDMREGCDSPFEYREHFGRLGDIIAKIEAYENFGYIYNAIAKEEFGMIGLEGNEEEMSDFLLHVHRSVEKWNK